MTFLRYSTLISSSDCERAGELGLDGLSRPSIEDLGDLSPFKSCLEAQYPTPGFLCRSRSAADDWTLRSSSRKV